jgi:hypothetical protein
MADEPSTADPPVQADDRVKLMILLHAARRTLVVAGKPLMASYDEAERVVAAYRADTCHDAQAALVEAEAARDRVGEELRQVVTATLAVQTQIAELKGRGVELVGVLDLLPRASALRELRRHVRAAVDAIAAALPTDGPASVMASLRETAELQDVWHMAFVAQSEAGAEEMAAFVDALVADDGSHLRLPLAGKWRATADYAAETFAHGPVTRKDDLTAVLDVANGLLEAQGGAKW